MESTHRAQAGRRAAIAAVAAVLLAACSAPPSSVRPSAGSPAPFGSADQTIVRPLIVDLDLDPGDLLALAYVLHVPGYELRAVTVAGAGVVHCPPGDGLVTALLQELGVTAPVACGSDAPIGEGHALPEDRRTAADQLWGLRLSAVENPEQRSASELIADTLAASEVPVDILQLGPATNLASVLDARPDLRNAVHRVVMYAGAFDVTGDVTREGRGSPEWTVWADPQAAATVVGSGLPVTLVPLDAAMGEPIPGTFVAELAANHAGAGANLLFEWLTTAPNLLSGGHFTGAIAATVLEDPEVVELNELPVRVGTGTWGELGRTIRDAAGTPVQVALVTDSAVFNAVFMAGLRRGTRAHPFTIVGPITLAYDGARCVVSGSPPVAAGGYTVSLENRTEHQLVAEAVMIRAGHTWQELIDFVATIDQRPEDPGAFDGSAVIMPGEPTTIVLPSGTSGFACVEIADNDALVKVLLSDPFTIEK